MPTGSKVSKTMRRQDSLPPPRQAAGPIELPKPTPEQRAYLRETKRPLEDYQPDVLVGGAGLPIH